MVTHASLTTFKSTRRCDYHLTLPYSPHPTLLTSPYPTLPYSTLLTLPEHVNITSPYPTLPYLPYYQDIGSAEEKQLRTYNTVIIQCLFRRYQPRQTNYDKLKHNTRAKARVAARTRARARVVIRIPLHALSVGNGPKEFTYPSPLSQLLYVMCLDCCLLPLQEAGIPSVLGEATALAHTRRHAALSSLRAGETTAHQV